MLSQELFLKNIGTKAGVKLEVSKKAESLASYDAPFLHGGNYAVCPEQTSGYSDPLLTYNVPEQHEGMYFGYVEKIRKVLYKNRNNPDRNTRMHCRRLLDILEKAME